MPRKAVKPVKASPEDVKPNIASLNINVNMSGTGNQKRIISQSGSNAKKPRSEEPSTSTVQLGRNVIENRVDDVKLEGDQLENDNASQDQKKIKISIQDALGGVVEFRMSSSMPMGKVMQAYYQQKQLPTGQLNFQFDGMRLRAEDTAEKLEMDNDAVIMVFEFQLGG